MSQPHLDTVLRDMRSASAHIRAARDELRSLPWADGDKLTDVGVVLTRVDARLSDAENRLDFGIDYASQHDRKP